jgi:hypothetical protein
MKKALGYDVDEKKIFHLHAFMKALLDIYAAAEAAQKKNDDDWIKDVTNKVVRAIVSVVSGETILASESWANLVNILGLFRERFKSAKFAVWEISDGRAELQQFQYGGASCKNVESYKQLFSKDTVHVWLSEKHYEFAVVKQQINFTAFDDYVEENSSVVQLFQSKRRRIVSDESPPLKCPINVKGQKRVEFKSSPESISVNPTFLSPMMTPYLSQNTDSESFTQNTPSENESLNVNSILVQIRESNKLDEQTLSRLDRLTNKELRSIVECIYTLKNETFVKSRFTNKNSYLEEIRKRLL